MLVRIIFMTQISPVGFSPHYRNITISGLPGSGSTTLLTGLKLALQFEGWKGFNGGEFMRAYAKEKGLVPLKSRLHHNASAYEDDFDRQVDFGMRERLEKENKWILESWLSGFVAQGIHGVLKVLMTCSDKAVRIDRIVNRDGVSAEAVLQNMNERYQKNLAKWKRMYHDFWQKWVVETGTMKATDAIDFWHPNLYDLVIDTYSLNKQESVQAVLDALQKK